MAHFHPQAYTLSEAREKIQRYCAYRERSHREVQEKLRAYGLAENKVQALMAELIEQQFLNEERFACAYTRGKHRHNGWGWLKIKQGLQYHHLSDYLLKKAQAELTGEEYQKNLQALAHKQWYQYKALKPFARRGKTARYLMQRGYEPQLVWDIVKDLND